ncbi:unnamed protein product [Blepharisma stoltei]|uniref:Kelch motif family protein n=1 Tax=Blepharisma stoltei TaxID=1481888 RepID=A0AAU9J0K7_9CILI|nr:unnamed protein product [Blepharisma stoltei]
MIEIASLLQRNLQLPTDSEEIFLYQIFDGLHKVDITALTSAFFQIYIQEKSPQYVTSLCKLRNGNLFCAGVYCKELNIAGIAFTLDVNTLQVTPLPYGPKIYDQGLINHNEFVYAFGGKEQKGDNFFISGLAYRFNLSSSRWERIAKMPQPNYQISCIEYERFIVVAGYEDETIYLYDYITNSYAPLFLFTKRIPKTLFKYNSELFLLEGAKLWKSANFASWELVMEYSYINKYTVTTNVLIKEKIAYFAINFKSIAMLNFETFELNKTILVG